MSKNISNKVFMNKMDWFVLCPVPRDQRPFYEYIKRKDSTILCWVGFNECNYTSRFFLTLLGIFSVTLPFTSWFISLKYYPFQTVLVKTFVALFFQSLIY